MIEVASLLTAFGLRLFQASSQDFVLIRWRSFIAMDGCGFFDTLEVFFKDTENKSMVTTFARTKILQSGHIPAKIKFPVFSLC